MMNWKDLVGRVCGLVQVADIFMEGLRKILMEHSLSGLLPKI